MTFPEWISPPGEIVSQILSSRRTSLEEFATNVGLTSRRARGVLEGTTRIDEELAARLALVVGSTPGFWLRCERTYREDIERILPALVDEDVINWLARLPLKEMSKFGWISLHADPLQQTAECFRFFGVNSLDDWKRQHKEILARANFRTSEAFSIDPTATSAWLRWAEECAEDETSLKWNKDAFLETLLKIRNLTRNHHPQRFTPQLKRLCAAAGVALIIAPAPKGCRASGATKMIRHHKAMIVLSFRYYSDDHFWFTFFHEAGHLILHAEQELFLEDNEAEGDQKEAEANDFARDLLVPANRRNEMLNLRPTHKDYIRFASEIGISPGIVVGQMQRLSLLPFTHLNRLKRRFNWNELYEQNLIP